MDEYVLEEFDDIIRKLNQAKKLYSAKRYEDCYREADAARVGCYGLLSDIEVAQFIEREDRGKGEPSPQDKIALAALNAVLADLEEKIKEAVSSLEVQSEAMRLTENDPLLREYAVEVILQYRTTQKDPVLQSKGRDVIAQYSFGSNDPADFERLADGVNYN